MFVSKELEALTICGDHETERRSEKGYGVSGIAATSGKNTAHTLSVECGEPILCSCGEGYRANFSGSRVAAIRCKFRSTQYWSNQSFGNQM